MKIPATPPRHIRFHHCLITATAFLIGMAFAQGAVAGKIVSGSSESYAPDATIQPFEATGFGGWNLGNVEVVLSGTNSSYDELDGYYHFDPVDSDYTYFAAVSDDMGTVTGLVLAKPWPVGEPSGIKIINDDLAVKAPKPVNCIMATSYLAEHYLDSTDPRQVLCSGPFQSHKRYKLAMLPTTVAGGAGSEQGIDLVFNVEDEPGSRDYQVFQKINNWTDGRLEGFSIQVGTGTGDSFVPAGAPPGVGIENLSLSVPAAIWNSNQLAVFSTGLFGPPDTKHDRPAGFFDPDTRAGFIIQEYPNLSGETDTLRSGATLGSDYADIPPDGGAADGQFGAWLSNNMLPHGIFWDDDGNPETDAALMAWYGYDPVSLGYRWMGGADTGFAAISDATILEWGSNLEYTEGLIDDLVNVGLNYIVTIGDVSGFPDGSFTIRITPQVDTSGDDAPGYTTQTPTPSLLYTSSEGVVTISPSPEFITGDLLTARVGDADLNQDPAVAETLVVEIATTSGLSGSLTLEEQGENRGVFAATLPESYSEVAVGTGVSVTYTDDDIGDGSSAVRTASTTAADDLPPAPVAVVSIADFSVPSSLFIGQSGKVSVTVQSEKESEVPVSGEVVIAASGIEVLRESFTDLEPNKRFRTSTTWTATDEGSISWTAAVIVEGQLVDSALAVTSVTVKPGNGPSQ